jgi:MoaA/NifB/PqqE/SkfB family radical SAM enzyme
MKKFITNSKIFYHAKELNKYLSGQSFNPVSVELHISNLCNNRCYYCGQENNKDGAMMSYDKIIEAIKFVKSIGAKSIYFSGGGEPTINSGLWRAMLHARHMARLDVGLITNGINISMFEYEIVRSCNWVRISLDAADRETYKYIRGVDKYDKVHDNILRLIMLKETYCKDCIIGLQVIPNKYNYKKLYLVVKSLLKQFPGIDYIQVRPIETMQNDKPYTRFQEKIIYAQLKALESVNKIIISDKWYNKNFGFVTCHASAFSMTIDVHGRCHVCCHTMQNKNYELYNIFNIDIDYEYTINNALLKLGKSRGFNPAICPVNCRGSVINRSIENILSDPHKNFI